MRIGSREGDYRLPPRASSPASLPLTRAQCSRLGCYDRQGRLLSVGRPARCRGDEVGVATGSPAALDAVSDHQPGKPPMFRTRSLTRLLNAEHGCRLSPRPQLKVTVERPMSIVLSNLTRCLIHRIRERNASDSSCASGEGDTHLLSQAPVSLSRPAGGSRAGRNLNELGEILESVILVAAGPYR